MTTNRPAASRLLLMTDPAREGGDRTAAKVRRYRLARVRLEGPGQGAQRHAHPRRAHD
jgi:hypothetical protein